MTSCVHARNASVIERGGGPGGETLRAEIDPANMPAGHCRRRSASCSTRRGRPWTDDRPSGTAYDIVLDYGDRDERLRYDEDELPGDIRVALDARLEAQAADNSDSLPAREEDRRRASFCGVARTPPEVRRCGGLNPATRLSKGRGAMATTRKAATKKRGGSNGATLMDAPEGLALGSSGNDVKLLQNYLSRFGYLT